MVRLEELKTVLKLIRSEIAFIVNERMTPKINNYSSNYDELYREGCTVIRGYVKDPESLKLTLDGFWDNEKAWSDNEGCDTRIWGGFEKSNKIFKDIFTNDLDLLNIYKKYISRNTMSSVLMANKIIPSEGNMGSGGTWHRDDKDGRQLKFILYLTNVSSENGNFRYVKRSHRLKNKFLSPFLLKSKISDSRFNSNDIDILKKAGYEIEDILGRAGDLIIVDTSGIHRGAPIKSGERIAITNYLWNLKRIPDKIKALLID